MLPIERRIKILHVFAPSYKTRFGGPIYTWKYYFNRWNDPGIEHYVLDYDKKKMVDAKSAFQFKLSDVQRKRTRLERGFWFFPLLYLLLKNRGKYHIIHFHVLWWAGLVTGYWTKCVDIPSIYESVLLDSDTPSGIIQEKCGKIKVKLLKSFTAILAISHNLAEDYRKMGFPHENVYVLLNSVDDRIFSPPKSSTQKDIIRTQLNLPRHQTILLFVGSIIERKGVDILIQSCMKILRRRKDTLLVLLGPQNTAENPSLEEEYVQRLKRSVIDNKLTDQVLFKGLIKERDKISEFFKAADIFIFPSRKEGLPNVVLEAMASGIAVIVSRLPGIEHVITHQRNGLLVPIDDPAGLEDSIEKLIRNKELREKISRRAASTIRGQHHFKSWQAALKSIYRELFQEKYVE